MLISTPHSLPPIFKPISGLIDGLGLDLKLAGFLTGWKVYMITRSNLVNTVYYIISSILLEVSQQASCVYQLGAKLSYIIHTTTFYINNNSQCEIKKPKDGFITRSYSNMRIQFGCLGHLKEISKKN